MKYTKIFADPFEDTDIEYEELYNPYDEVKYEEETVDFIRYDDLTFRQLYQGYCSLYKEKENKK